MPVRFLGPFQPAPAHTGPAWVERAIGLGKKGPHRSPIFPGKKVLVGLRKIGIRDADSDGKNAVLEGESPQSVLSRIISCLLLQDLMATGLGPLLQTL
jgi:hypothetical protein